ncbi:heme-degrading domain-containing protein [Micromonospora sp. STR1_7]|uniref:Heme-degrading domain-containing protein n=1 Tax=Micromonospora parastrephiae TaxID=2806101 RepID=A0ABS1XNG8_9ACTN|nr:heme-degrading domain-containing protein [Micromonospora parastrephiae]MBM0230800.1 heme-degrading domain-containing protein [Micromonospora parastrephiae]
MSSDQWPTLDELLREESELELAGLTETDAYDLGVLAVTAAAEQRLPISVGVWRTGRQLFHCGLPGSTADNDGWLRRKGRVVTRFEHSSLYMARLCQDKHTTLTEKFGLPASRYAAAGGAVPLRVRGTGVVGWFGVSGLPQLDDHRFVVDILRKLPR